MWTIMIIKVQYTFILPPKLREHTFPVEILIIPIEDDRPLQATTKCMRILFPFPQRDSIAVRPSLFYSNNDELDERHFAPEDRDFKKSTIQLNNLPYIKVRMYFPHELVSFLLRCDRHWLTFFANDSFPVMQSIVLRKFPGSLKKHISFSSAATAERRSHRSSSSTEQRSSSSST